MQITLTGSPVTSRSFSRRCRCAMQSQSQSQRYSLYATIKSKLNLRYTLVPHATPFTLCCIRFEPLTDTAHCCAITFTTQCVNNNSIYTWYLHRHFHRHLHRRLHLRCRYLLRVTLLLPVVSTVRNKKLRTLTHCHLRLQAC